MHICMLGACQIWGYRFLGPPNERAEAVSGTQSLDRPAVSELETVQ